MSEGVVMLNNVEGRICTDLSSCASSEYDNFSSDANEASANIISRNIFDEPYYVPSSYQVTRLDIFCIILSIASYVLDVALDVYVAVNYYVLSQMEIFICTLVFIVVPSLATTLISTRWYVGDYKKNPEEKLSLKIWIIRCLVLLLQLAPTLRYAESLNYAIKSWRSRKNNEKEKERHYFDLMHKSDSDAALLRVFECFLESAPQLVLQLSILIYTNPKDYSMQEALHWASAVMSFASLAWALASYQCSVRFAQKNKDNISGIGMTFQFFWHLMIIVSRVVALSCIASKIPHWLIFGCAMHIIVFYIYLSFKGPEGGESILWDKFLSLLLAAIYIFTDIHARDEPTRPFYSFLYSVYAMENIALVSVWFYFMSSHVPQFLNYLIPIASIGLFFLGICFMILYHLFFHPRKL